jgi:hypothetical protein
MPLLLPPQVGTVEALFTGLQDTAPILLRKYKKVTLTTMSVLKTPIPFPLFFLQYSLLVASVFFIIIGVPMATHAGTHWITLIDTYGASGIPLLFVVFFEVVGLAWGFGEPFHFPSIHQQFTLPTSFSFVKTSKIQ